MDKLTIKPITATTLSHVQRNEVFCAITATAMVAPYSVGGARCLGVIFDRADDADLHRLERFCARVLLDFFALPMPWDGRQTLVLIRPIGNWSPTCLRNVSSVSDL